MDSLNYQGKSWGERLGDVNKDEALLTLLIDQCQTLGDWTTHSTLPAGKPIA